MSIYDVPVKSLDGGDASLKDHEGEAVLFVNVASKCGLTPQYEGLERLQKKYADKGFTVIGVPSNQFMGQEPGTADEIKEFCSTTYGVTFPLLEKTDVNGPESHPLYLGLTGAAGHDHVKQYTREHPIEECVILGTRLGEGSSYWADHLVPARGFIHVDIDPAAIGTSFTSVGVLGVQSDAGAFLRCLRRLLPAAQAPSTLRPLPPEPVLEARSEGDVRPQFLMQVIQRRIVEDPMNRAPPLGGGALRSASS